MLTNTKGEPMVIKKAICMHEEDYGAPAISLADDAVADQSVSLQAPRQFADGRHTCNIPVMCAGVLWKHTEYRTEHLEARRSRRLVISFFATIANYECECSTVVAEA